MGLFDRLSSLIKANLNDLISKAEDPEKMLNQVLIDMRSQLVEAKKQVAVAIADEKRLHKQLERLDLLILDELGYVPFSKTGAELLFDVISRAYESTSLIVTTNLPFENWVEVMGSERLTGATLDRLTHRVHILEANGPSYRLQDAKARLKKK